MRKNGLLAIVLLKMESGGQGMLLWALIVSEKQHLCFFFFFFFFFICSEFCHTLKWKGLGFTCLPHPDPPSHLPPHRSLWYIYTMECYSAIKNSFASQHLGPKGWTDDSSASATQSYPTLCNPLGDSLYPQNSSGRSTGVGCLFPLQGIFLTQGQNLGLLHCRQILYCLSHQGEGKIVNVHTNSK